jgi:hypothetical protein
MGKKKNMRVCVCVCVCVCVYCTLFVVYCEHFLHLHRVFCCVCASTMCAGRQRRALSLSPLFSIVQNTALEATNSNR